MPERRFLFPAIPALRVGALKESYTTGPLRSRASQRQRKIFRTFAIERAGISAHLRSSIIEGLQAVIEQGSAALSFILLLVPSLLFWVALFFWPARFGWRRARIRNA
jgi:hypothetical protein